MYDKDHVYSWDIETLNDEEHGFNGLIPARTRITQVSLALSTEALVFEGDEFDILRDFNAALAELPPGLLSDWNGSHFDLPMADDRAQACGLAADVSKWGLELIPQPGLVPKYEYLPGHSTGYAALWHSDQVRGGFLGVKTPHAHIDIATAYRAFAESFGVHPEGHPRAGKPVVPWSLKPVAKAMGITMVELDRTKLHTYTAEEQRAYSASDSIGTRLLTLRTLGLDS